MSTIISTVVSAIEQHVHKLVMIVMLFHTISSYDIE